MNYCICSNVGLRSKLCLSNLQFIKAKHIFILSLVCSSICLSMYRHEKHRHRDVNSAAYWVFSRVLRCQKDVQLILKLSTSLNLSCPGLAHGLLSKHVWWTFIPWSEKKTIKKCLIIKNIKDIKDLYFGQRLSFWL